MTQPAFQSMSVEEYLRREETSPVRHEYVNGFVYPLAQAGTSDAHALISTNIVLAVGPAARKKGCFTYTSDMRVTTPDQSSYFYPDVLVTCEPFQAEARVKTAPCLRVEVLSRSTAHTDHFAKYYAYTSLPSLALYLLVEQSGRLVYTYERTERGWLKREYRGAYVIPLPFLDAELPLDEIYQDVWPE